MRKMLLGIGMFFVLILTHNPAFAQYVTVPAWITSVPTGEQYQYFRGVGMDADMERAKVLARSDVFKQIQMLKSAGSTSDLVESV